jgi:hypothetical protein
MPAAVLAHERGKSWVEMGTWLRTTESSFTREMCSMASGKRNKSSALCWMARRLGALLTCVGEREA